jgi:hypothetical protein
VLVVLGTESVSGKVDREDNANQVAEDVNAYSYPTNHEPGWQRRNHF